jgi:serine/threonine protein kinase
MQAPSQQTCPSCGGVLEKTPSGELGCVSCLLRAGIGSEVETVHDSTPGAPEGGLHFGVYEIDHREDGSLYELGRGAMGVTYRATDTSLHRKVSLKIIKIDIAERSADARERFMREARAAAALRHENIATVHQFGMRLETGQYFYAMELIEGETLEDRVRRAGPLDARTTIKIAQQVTSALTAAEKHGLVHRDLKPANLMLVSTDGETGNHKKLLVKIIDFGLAKAVHTQTDPKSLTHDRFVGTPAFASPEQFEHAALDVRSDIYSLGETLWFALTGKTPFGGRSIEEIHRAQKSDVLPVEQLKAAHVPSRLRSVLESMLAFEPASRPGTSELAAQLQRCSPEVRSVRRTRFSLAATSLMVLGMSAAIIFLWVRTQNSIPNLGAPEKSIAVLPFDNRSEDKANAYFADGIQDEILTRLSKLADLKVISRTSVLQYKTGVARNLREIGHQLGISHIVEGSVQRAANRVRVNVQLLDARTDAHLWAQTYDRDLADVFAIQSEIAQAIADQLQAKISPKDKEAITERPTKDLAAYDLYLRAKELLSERSWNFDTTRKRENYLKAVQLLDQAVARDPAFSLAYCQLAYAHDLIYWFSIDRTESRLALAEASVNAAIQLQPDSGETHLAQAIHFFWGYRNYDRAREELTKAERILPNNARIFHFLGLIDRRQGRWDEAVRNLEQAVDLDPRNSLALAALGNVYLNLRRYGESMAMYNRALALEPRNITFRIFPPSILVDAEANTAPLRAVINTIEAEGPSSAAEVAKASFQLALYERDPVAAARVLTNIPSQDDISVLNFRTRLNPMNFPHAGYEGLLAKLRQDVPGAHSAFTAARAEVEKIVGAHPGIPEPVRALARIDAELGQKEKAIQEGRTACDMESVEKEAAIGVSRITDLARIYALTGEKDLALEQLEIVNKLPAGPSYGELRLDPAWDALRGDPRFEKIVASLAPKAK